MSDKDLMKSTLHRVHPLRGASSIELAVVAKLQRGNATVGGRRNNRSIPDLNSVTRTVNRTANNINDAKNLFQVLPDMELAKSILINAIISPADLGPAKVIYSLAPNEFDDKLTGPMLEVIADKFDNFYKINKDIYVYLEHALFMKGSHPILILPENSIDALINSDAKITMESLSDEFEKNGNVKSYGILGVPDNKGGYTKPSFESMFIDRTEDNFRKTVSLEQSTVLKELPSLEQNSKKKAAVGNVYVTDNLALLRRPAIEERLRQSAQADIYARATGRRPSRHRHHVPIVEKDNGVSQEGAAKVSELEAEKMSLDHVERLFYKNRVSPNLPMQTVLTRKQLKRATVGHPLWMNLPAEAVIPIHVPGNPRKHIGYFIVNDMFGNPLSLESVSDYYNDIRSTLQSDSVMASSLMGTARRSQNGYGILDTQEIESMQRTYQQTIENDLLGRLRSGVLTGDFELANIPEIYAMMMARSLASKQTMLLYVPAEMMIYIAFDYNEFGVGKSLIEDAKTLASMRAVMMVANTLGATGNMINGKNVNLNVPEEDEDPASTVAFMIGEFAKLNRSGAAIGETNPNEIINRLQEAAVTFTVQGNTRFPEARTEVTTAEGTNKIVDKEWDDELRRRHYQTFYLTPEMVDGVNSADFAATVVNQSTQLKQRVMQIQGELNPFLSQIGQVCSYSSGEILNELKRVVRESGEELPAEYENDIDAFVDDFIALIQLALPSPETSSLEAKMKGYQDYASAVDEAIKVQLDPDNMKVFVSENVAPEHIKLVGDSISAMLKRKYLRERNILPELDIFNAINELDDPATNWIESMAEDYGDRVRIVEKFISRMLKQDVDNKPAIDKNQERIEALSGGGDVTFDDDNSFSEDQPAGDGDEFSLDDELGGTGGDDIPLDEPPADAPADPIEETEPDLDDPEAVQ